MASKPDQLLFRLRPEDSASGISRATLTRIARRLGFTETQVVHLALRKLAQEVLPAYEADDGAVRADTLRALRKRESQRRVKSVASSIIR
jgi:antitoxin component of RelBE/YafQ-DinJ toxin-antitoxin module